MNRPLLSICLRQATRIRFLVRLTERQAAHIAMLQRRLAEAEVCDPNADLHTENERLRGEMDLLALCIPHNRRDIALALLRDRRRIERGDIVREAG